MADVAPVRAVTRGGGFEAGPSAASLVEGLRDFGYSLETALADIIDNSISAGATQIDVLARFDGDDSVIGVIDNGAGMTAQELRSAMRLASTSPSGTRALDDLGRFGLGMKTASFSQCRRMTVVTRRDGALTTARWDLDEVVRRDAWYVLEPEPEEVPWSERLVSDGTLVVWQELDRVVSGSAGTADSRYFAQRLAEASDHLELVFHRFLARERSRPLVTITLNNRTLKPSDPFAESHPATIRGPEETIRTRFGKLAIRPFTLPHHSNLDRDCWERLGGRDGYIKNQGFYVYRARRLIVWGTWFGIAKQTERTKLARVRIDLPNSLDEPWKINVLKASAEPPDAVRRRLKTLIEAIVASSKRIYTHRGVKQAAGADLPTWQRVQTRTGIRYVPNPDHPLIQTLLSGVTDESGRRLLMVLDLLSRTLPVDSILHDLSENPDQLNIASMNLEDLTEMARGTANTLRERGANWERILTMMKTSPPFNSQWDDTVRIIDEMRTEL